MSPNSVFIFKMTPNDMDFSCPGNWKAISNPDIHGRVDKIMLQVLGTMETATVSTTRIFSIKNLEDYPSLKLGLNKNFC